MAPSPYAGDRRLLEAIPHPALVVDHDVRILELNARAAELAAAPRESALLLRAGEAFSCLHSSESHLGCGHAHSCRFCVIRNSVASCLEGGTVLAHPTRFERPGVSIPLFVTANSLDLPNRQVLLVLQTAAIPDQPPVVCMDCHHVLHPSGERESLFAHFRRTLGLQFSHGLCPECARLRSRQIH